MKKETEQFALKLFGGLVDCFTAGDEWYWGYPENLDDLRDFVLLEDLLKAVQEGCGIDVSESLSEIHRFVDGFIDRKITEDATAVAKEKAEKAYKQAYSLAMDELREDVRDRIRKAKQEFGGDAQ